MENIKIGDKFMGSNGLFLVTDIYLKNNKYWIVTLHLESGQESHTDYNHFTRLTLTKVNWDYIKEATQEDYEDIKAECRRIINDDMIGGFGRINFVDYSKYIIELVREFPQLIFKLECFGLNIDKREA